MTPFLEKVCDAVGERYGFSIGELIGDGRCEQIVAARRLIWAIARWHKPEFYTCSQLGREFNRDHSTIIIGWRRHGRKPLKPRRSGRPAPDRSQLIAYMLEVGYSQRLCDIADRFDVSTRIARRARARLIAAGNWPHKAPPGWMMARLASHSGRTAAERKAPASLGAAGARKG